jgi:endoglucanase
MDPERALAVLREVASIPTAPLHERDVAAYVRRFLGKLGLPPEVDAYGNLIAIWRNGESARPVALVAHLDHPGLEITTVGPTGTARAMLLGGVPSACFARPVSVRIITTSGPVPASIVGHAIDPQSGRVGPLDLTVAGAVRPGDFGVFDLPDHRRDGDQIALRVADDLAGVAASLLTLENVVSARLPGVVYGVFTRAEEVGLVGAALLAEDKRLHPDTVVISLECSRALPGAEQGNGAVIRVGDRTSAFSPEGEALLLAAREQLPGLPIQRQLMSGGSCEATAFGLAGYRTTGVALPLLNYHNVGPGDVIAPELIDARDFLGEIALLTKAIELAPFPSSSAYERRLQTMKERYRERLCASAGEFAG